MPSLRTLTLVAVFAPMAVGCTSTYNLTHETEHPPPDPECVKMVDEGKNIVSQSVLRQLEASMANKTEEPSVWQSIFGFIGRAPAEILHSKIQMSFKTPDGEEETPEEQLERADRCIRYIQDASNEIRLGRYRPQNSNSLSDLRSAFHVMKLPKFSILSGSAYYYICFRDKARRALSNISSHSTQPHYRRY